MHPPPFVHYIHCKLGRGGGGGGGCDAVNCTCASTCVPQHLVNHLTPGRCAVTTVYTSMGQTARWAYTSLQIMSLQDFGPLKGVVFTLNFTVHIVHENTV